MPSVKNVFFCHETVLCIGALNQHSTYFGQIDGIKSHFRFLELELEYHSSAVHRFSRTECDRLGQNDAVNTIFPPSLLQVSIQKSLFASPPPPIA